MIVIIHKNQGDGIKKMKKVPYPELTAEIAKSGELQSDIAKLLSIGTSTVCRKINGQTDWTLSEAKILCDHYGKSFEDLFTECRR